MPQPSSSPERLPAKPGAATPGRVAQRRPATAPKSKTDPDALLPRGVYVPTPKPNEEE